MEFNFSVQAAFNAYFKAVSSTQKKESRSYMSIGEQSIIYIKGSEINKARIDATIKNQMCQVIDQMGRASGKVSD